MYHSILYIIIKTIFLIFAIISIYDIFDLHVNNKNNQNLRYIERIAISLMSIFIGIFILNIKILGTYSDIIYAISPFMIVTAISNIIIDTKIYLH